MQKIVFPNSKGERLAARLDLPADEKPVVYAIFAHCFTCTENLKAVVNSNRTLAGEGIAVPSKRCGACQKRKVNIE